MEFMKAQRAPQIPHCPEPDAAESRRANIKNQYSTRVPACRSGREEFPQLAWGFINERAFTLIELMLVLTIMGILATVSWEGQKALLKRYQLLGASRMLVSDLRAVQQQAVASRQRCWIDFDPEQDGYSLWMAGQDDQGHLIRQVRFPASVRFGSGAGGKVHPAILGRSPNRMGLPLGITLWSSCRMVARPRERERFTSPMNLSERVHRQSQYLSWVM